MSENLKNYPSETSAIEVFEQQIWDSNVAVLEDEVEKLDREKAFLNKLEQEKEYKNALYTEMLKELNVSPDFKSREHLALLDAVFSEPEALIRESHNYLEHSLIKRQPDLKKHIPGNQGRLYELLNINRCRAYEVIEEYTSQNTMLAHSGDLIYWQAYLDAVGFTFREAITEKEVAKFIIQHTNGIDIEIDKKLVDQKFKQKLGPHKLATVKRRVASLSVFLDRHHLDNPCRDSKVIRDLFNQLNKKYGTARSPGNAITKDILDVMISTCNSNKLIDIRDKALLLFAWASGGRKRSEVTAADIKNLNQAPNNNYIYSLPVTNTGKEHTSHNVPVSGRASQALTEWLMAGKIQEGAIFRSIGKGGDIKKALSPNDVYRIVKRRLTAAGFDAKLYNAHSLRSGFITEAGLRGKPLNEVMAMTNHKDVGTVMKYYQTVSMINNSSANLAD